MMNSEEIRAKVKETIGLRHPGNKTEWPDPFTLVLEGDVHNQTELVLKQSGAKRID
jgi:hypothetical protein